MTYRLEITRRAEADRNECFDFIYGESPEGAVRWLDAFEDAATAILAQPNYGEAPESADYDETIRQKLFRTPHGRAFRLLYVMRDEVISIIHVRGAGQDTMKPDEVELPD